MKLEVGRPINEKGRLQKEIRTYNYLDRLNIAYERIDHMAHETMEACHEIDELISPAFMCKNLFLCNSNKTQFFLLLMRGDKKFVTKDISHQIGSTRLSFATAEDMEKYLDITPGSVSIMGLINDREHHVQLLVDEDVLKSELFACHPCINTSSMRMKTRDVFTTFISETGHTYHMVHIEN